jgi:hypothetical protein
MLGEHTDPDRIAGPGPPADPNAGGRRLRRGTHQPTRSRPSTPSRARRHTQRGCCCSPAPQVIGETDRVGTAPILEASPSPASCCHSIHSNPRSTVGERPGGKPSRHSPRRLPTVQPADWVRSRRRTLARHLLVGDRYRTILAVQMDASRPHLWRPRATPAPGMTSERTWSLLHGAPVLDTGSLSNSE